MESDPFKSQQKAKENADEVFAKGEFGKLYRQLAFKIHFNRVIADFGNDHPLTEEATALTQRLNVSRDLIKKTVENKGMTWKDGLREIKKMESEIDNFVSRVEAEREKKKNAGKKDPSGKKSSTGESKKDPKTEPDPEPESKTEPEPNTKTEPEEEKNGSYTKKETEEIFEERKRQAEENKQGGNFNSSETETEETKDDFDQDYGKRRENNDAEEIEKDLMKDLGGKKFEEKEGEKGENKEKKTEEERKERLEQLKLEVEQKRKEYLEVDYKRKNDFKRIGNFFGKMVKEKEEKNLENDQEIAWYRAYYDDALMQYKGALLEDAKLKGSSDKELLDIAKEFQAEASINIAAGHTKVKIEINAGGLSEFIKNKSLDLVEKYKGMSTAKKIAIGAAFGLTAMGAGYFGGVAVAVAGSAVLARRAFLSFVTGVSTSLSAKNIARGREEIKMKKEAKGWEEKLSGMSEEEKIKFIESIANGRIKDEDNKIDKIKNKNLRHLTYGVAAGAATMLMPRIMKMASNEGWGWIKEHILGKSGGGASYFPDSEGQSAGKGAFYVSPEDQEKMVSETETGNPDDVMGTKVPEEELSGATQKTAEAVINIEKGSSFEGSIIKYLNANPNLIEKYNELNSGRKFNAGQIAHRMAEQFAKDAPEVPGNKVSGLGLVHEGAKITINPNTMEVDMLEDNKGFGDLSEKTITSETKVDTDYLKKMMSNSVVEENGKAGPGISPEDAEKEFSNVDQTERNKITKNFLEKNEELKKWQSEPASKWETGIHENHLNKLSGEEKNLWEELLREKTVPDVAGDLRKAISLNNIENWRKIKDLTFSQANHSGSGIGDEVKKKLSGIYQNSYAVLGEEGKPKRGETVAKWTERVSRFIIKMKK